MVEGPRILLIDVEVSPTLGWLYRLYDADVLEVEREWKFLSISLRFLGEKPETKILPDVGNSEERLVRWAHRKMSKADIVVGHNIDGFDKKKLNSGFILYGLKPLDYRTVDTLKIARQKFGFTSNKLGDLAHRLGFGQKLHVDKRTWLGCLEGQKSSWEHMRRYNRRDVILLEKIYLALRPWGSHPNVALWHDGFVCSKCQSKDISSDGLRRTATLVYRRLICKDCGNRMRGSVERRSKPLVSI